MIWAGCNENAFTTERSSIFIGASTPTRTRFTGCHRTSLPQTRRAAPKRPIAGRNVVSPRETGDHSERAVAGALVALGAAWLFPQRSDPGSRLIAGLLFAGGIGLLLVPPGATHRVLRAHRRGACSLSPCSASVRTSARRRRRAHWFGGGITHGSTTPTPVALTFDDGPNVSATLRIMKILDAAGVKGTFFEVGKAIDAEPEITRSLYEHGQLLGNHSYDARPVALARPALSGARTNAAGISARDRNVPAYYRPPHGDRTPFIAHVVSDHHMRIVMWNVSAGDWDRRARARSPAKS